MKELSAIKKKLILIKNDNKKWLLKVDLDKLNLLKAQIV